MAKISQLIILLMCAVNLIPPLFAPGGMFDFWTEEIEVCGHTEVVSGVFFDNVYYSLLFITFTVIGIALPYFQPKMPFYFKAISTFIGAWFFSGLVVELINFTRPLLVFNNASEPALYFKYVLFLGVGSTFLTIYIKWNQTN
jgi:hypothetical protein